MEHFWQLLICWNALNSVSDLQSFRFVSNRFVPYAAKFYNFACQAAFSKANEMDLSMLKISRVSVSVFKA